jgi:hypothetical protein
VCKLHNSGLSSCLHISDCAVRTVWKKWAWLERLSKTDSLFGFPMWPPLSVFPSLWSRVWCKYLYVWSKTFADMQILVKANTHTHTYIYIYIYIYVHFSLRFYLKQLIVMLLIPFCGVDGRNRPWSIGLTVWGSVFDSRVSKPQKGLSSPV